MRKTKNEVFFNARLKYYPTLDGKLEAHELLVFPEPTFKEQGWEVADDIPSVRKKKSDEPDSDSARKARGRAKNRLFDLLMSNRDIDYFVTLTFDPDKVDRMSYDDVIKKLGTWLDNKSRRQGLRYILCPEYHKKGGIHFHGFMNCESLKLEAARSPHTGRLLKTSGKKQIYNIESFPLGFTTAVMIGEDEREREAVAKYVYKYITKSDAKIGGRYYLHGGELREPVTKLFDLNYFDVPADAVSTDWGEFKRIRTPQEIAKLTFLGE